MDTQATPVVANLAALLLLLLLPGGVRGFFPNGWDMCNRSDATHESITETSLQRVAQSLGATEGEIRESAGYQDALQTIVAANQAVGGLEWSRAAMHFNGEELTAANEYLADTKDLAVLLLTNATLPDYVLVRQLIGRCLHLIQDFYSNTNWVEQYRKVAGETYHDLGVRGTSIAVAESPCISDKSRGTNINNILYGPSPFKLTSGYRSGQDAVKPLSSGLGPQGRPKGKCSHGGRWDSSARLEPRGGINKESSDSNLSPHHFSHEDARISAIEASFAFFMHPEQGMEKRIGKERLSKVLGLESSTRITLLINTRAAWLGSAAAHSAALRSIADALFTGTKDTRLDGVITSCASQQLMSSAAELVMGLMSMESKTVDTEMIENCLIAQPEKSSVAVVLDNELWSVSASEQNWWKDIAVQRSIKLFMFIKRGVLPRMSDLEGVLRNLSSHTGGGSYDFLDIEDFRQLMTALPLLASASGQAPMLRHWTALTLGPRQTAYVETSCSSEAAMQSKSLSTAVPVAVKDLWTTRTMALQEVVNLNDTGISIPLESTDCSSRVLQQTLPRVKLDVFTRGPYNQLFPARAIANTTGVTAVVKVSSVTSLQPTAIKVQQFGITTGSSSSEEIGLAPCSRARSAAWTAYVAELDVRTMVAAITVVDNGSRELLTVHTRVLPVRLAGPSHLTDAAELNVTNTGQTTVTVGLRTVAEKGKPSSLALSRDKLHLEPNSSASVRLQKLGAGYPHGCEQRWWRSSTNCSCSVRTRVVVIHMTAEDQVGTTSADVLPVTVIECVDDTASAERPVTADVTVSSRGHINSTTEAQALPTSSGQAMLTGTYSSTTSDAPGVMSLHVSEVTISTSASSAKTSTLLLLTRVMRPTADPSPSIPVVFTSLDPSQHIANYVTEFGTSTEGSFVSSITTGYGATALTAATPLQLMGMTLGGTLGIAAVFVAGSAGILYVLRLCRKKRSRLMKRDKDTCADEVKWLREDL